MLWLHGYTLDSSSFEEAWSFLPRFRHVGLDLPGHGGSARMTPGTTLRDLASRVVDVATREGALHLVALSFGTIVGLEVAMRHAKAFRTVTLAAPAIAGGPSDPEMARAYQRMSMLYRMAGRIPELVRMWLASPAWRGVETREGLRERLAEIVGRHGFEELLDRSRMSMFTGPPQSEVEIAGIDARLLILLGSNEMPAFKTCAATIERCVPRAKREELPGVEHLCILQAPEACARLIEAHLLAG